VATDGTLCISTLSLMLPWLLLAAWWLLPPLLLACAARP
jgi:hypothetical protein